MNQVLTIPNKAILTSIQHVLDTIPDVLPIPKKHKHDLSFAIRDLSRILTEERGYLNRSYWSSPRFLSAYVYYFLPWNLYRLASLIPNLSFQLLPGASILDLGSGPLTLPLALWCSRPDLRSIPLHFVCSDIAQKPMEVGLEIIRSLSLESPWTFSLERGPLEKIISSKKRTFHLIMGGNVLNELTPPKGMSLEERIGNIARAFPSRLAKEATVLLIEPGTRLGGKMVSLARKAGIECGFDPIAPCTHANPCPVMEQNFYYEQAPTYNGWCHFICDIENAPKELESLTTKAGFKRESLALSFLQMQWNKESESIAFDENSFDLDDLESLYAESMHDDFSDEDDAQSLSDQSSPLPKKNYSQQSMSIRSDVLRGQDSQNKQYELLKEIKGKKGDTHYQPNTKKHHASEPLHARIISSDIRLAQTTARYACSEVGLLLTTGARYAAFGERILAKCQKPITRDRKTSAIMADKVYEAIKSVHSKSQLPKQKETEQRRKSTQGSGVRADKQIIKKPLNDKEKRALEQTEEASTTLSKELQQGTCKKRSPRGKIRK